jgi:hypothetical protein
MFQHDSCCCVKGSYKKLKPEQCEMCLSTLEKRRKQLAYDVFVEQCDLQSDRFNHQRIVEREGKVQSLFQNIIFLIFFFFFDVCVLGIYFTAGSKGYKR